MSVCHHCGKELPPVKFSVQTGGDWLNYCWPECAGLMIAAAEKPTKSDYVKVAPKGSGK